MSFSSQRKLFRLFWVFVILTAVAGCQPSKPEPRQTVVIPDGEIDPSVWGKAYPEEYELWKKTADPKSKRISKYKTGMDGGLVTVDKLSEYPYMALLFNGWGFGTEYNEPRGHANMIRDQLAVDGDTRLDRRQLKHRIPAGPEAALLVLGVLLPRQPAKLRPNLPPVANLLQVQIVPCPQPFFLFRQARLVHSLCPVARLHPPREEMPHHPRLTRLLPLLVKAPA